jgi:hypothetical protein
VETIGKRKVNFRSYFFDSLKQVSVDNKIRCSVNFSEGRNGTKMRKTQGWEIIDLGEVQLYQGITE